MEDREIIEKIEKECSELSKTVIANAIKRIFRDLNKLEASMLSENYPKNFNFVDVLSIESQTKSYEEIMPNLHDTLWNYVDSEYANMPACEGMVLDLTNAYEYANQECTEVKEKLWSAFGQALNDHYEKTKKIQKFVAKCDWL